MILPSKVVKHTIWPVRADSEVQVKRAFFVHSGLTGKRNRRVMDSSLLDDPDFESISDGVTVLVQKIVPRQPVFYY